MMTLVSLSLGVLVHGVVYLILVVDTLRSVHLSALGPTELVYDNIGQRGIGLELWILNPWYRGKPFSEMYGTESASSQVTW